MFLSSQSVSVVPQSQLEARRILAPEVSGLGLSEYSVVIGGSVLFQSLSSDALFFFYEVLP